MPDPLDRLTIAQQKIDELFGPDYARQHPEVLVVVMQSAASDWAAARIAAALEFIGRAAGRGGGAAAAYRART
jgi:hypothetical protein